MIYNYRLEHFEGPLDLLLHLIEKHRIDIYDIPIVDITRQYFEYLDNWNHFDIVYSSEFLLMASTLLQIKSRMLLPKQSSVVEEAEDPRDSLVERLLEFKKIKEYTAILEKKMEAVNEMYSRDAVHSEIGKESIFDLRHIPLYQIFYDVMKEEEASEVIAVQVEKETYALEEAQQDILRALKEKKALVYRAFLRREPSKMRRITLFLAILELIKLQKLYVEMDEYHECILREYALCM